MNGMPSTYYCLALNLALHELPPGEEADAVQAALDNPEPETVRQVLKLGHGSKWVVRLEHALIEMGVVASAQIRCP